MNRCYTIRHVPQPKTLRLKEFVHTHTHLWCRLVANPLWFDWQTHIAKYWDYYDVTRQQSKQNPGRGKKQAEDKIRGLWEMFSCRQGKTSFKVETSLGIWKFRLFVRQVTENILLAHINKSVSRQHDRNWEFLKQAE